MAKRQFMGVYENMDFPEYEFREYPKWVLSKRKDEQGRPLKVLVGSKAEELKIIDELAPVEELDDVTKERDGLASALSSKDQELAEANAKIAELMAQLNSQGASAPKGKKGQAPASDDLTI